MTEPERIHVQLIGDIFTGHLRITYDGTDEEPEDAPNIAAMFNNHPERLSLLAANPAGIVLTPTETTDA